MPLFCFLFFYLFGVFLQFEVLTHQRWKWNKRKTLICLRNKSFSIFSALPDVGRKYLFFSCLSYGFFAVPSSPAWESCDFLEHILKVPWLTELLKTAFSQGREESCIPTSVKFRSTDYAPGGCGKGKICALLPLEEPNLPSGRFFSFYGQV